MKPVARSGGRSAIAAIAYRTGTKLLNERDGLLHDFTAKRGVEHKEIVLPDGVNAAWAFDRSLLWNRVEQSEKRRDARLAREFEIGLPHELSREQRIALTREFARYLANRYGTAVDFAIHTPSRGSDTRNTHAHLLMTTRTVKPEGLGEKTLIERENKWLVSQDQPTSHIQLRNIRQAWERHVNRQLARARLDVRIDHRSHLERGIEIEPTQHMGVHAFQMDRRGLAVSRARLDEMAARRNAELIRSKPEQILSVITGEKSVFDRHDVARALHRYITDPQSFQNALAAAMESPALVQLRPEGHDQLARYSTREMVQIEHAMAVTAARMAGARGYGVHQHHLDRALKLQDDTIRARAAASLSGNVEHADKTPAEHQRAGLSQQQRSAIHHITGPEQIATVIGLAGTGKSTMLAAARDAWERQGYRVHGAALAGKAAEGLQEASGIASRTLASWEYGWQAGRGLLGRDDVLVIDEAGMVESRQLARLVAEADVRGAKLVLIGDHKQLQAIGAGSPFRAIAERIGAVELTEIRRQREGWQREASRAFATHRTGEGLEAYAKRGAVQFSDSSEEARSRLVRDYLADLQERSSGSRIALAHRRVDVRAINVAIRSSLQERGQLARGENEQGQLGREVSYQTNGGKRSFASRDRIVLLENNRDLGVKNGMLGTVLAVELDTLRILLDGVGHNKAQAISIPARHYQAFDYGYATTIHKAQGTTVDYAFVMASRSMDQHLAYVAMTRHREGVHLYVGRDELKDLKALNFSLSRSGVKETTLDYTHASFKGEAEVRSEIAFNHSPGPAEERPSAQSRAREERILSPTASPTSAYAAYDRGARNERMASLVPALTEYSQSVEDVARARAQAALKQAMEGGQSIYRRVYTSADDVVERIKRLIESHGTSLNTLVSGITKRPEDYGELRGKTGFLGDNKERQTARHFADALGRHVTFAAETWERRLKEERASETFRRQKRDVIDVPGLSPYSESILKHIDRLPDTEKPKFLRQLSNLPEGQHALEEMKAVVRAFEKRFGSTDLWDLKEKDLHPTTRNPSDVPRIKDVARIVHQARRTELSNQDEVKRSPDRGLER